MTLNPNPRVRKKCLVVYLRKKGYRREEVAELLRIDEDTVTNYTKKYDERGLPGLLEENYHQPKSQLEPYTEQLKELFKKQLPHTCLLYTSDAADDLTRVDLSGRRII